MTERWEESAPSEGGVSKTTLRCVIKSSPFPPSLPSPYPFPLPPSKVGSGSFAAVWRARHRCAETAGRGGEKGRIGGKGCPAHAPGASFLLDGGAASPGHFKPNPFRPLKPLHNIALLLSTRVHVHQLERMKVSPAAFAAPRDVNAMAWCVHGRLIHSIYGKVSPACALSDRIAARAPPAASPAAPAALYGPPRKRLYDPALLQSPFRPASPTRSVTVATGRLNRMLLCVDGRPPRKTPAQSML